ncbi:MAG: HAMP domain-containing histidine kinase [Chloroflexi bacterium]|nr:HAMP domain-containing histidine kinase [Chloroflexota bacterium]
MGCRKKAAAMDDCLATWLEAHKERLVSLSVAQLSSQELLRKELEGPVRWFFDHLVRVLVSGEKDNLESLLRNWVRMSAVPINGQAVGLLPVLGEFKRAIWQEYQAEPPSENPLSLAFRLDGVLTAAAEFLSKIEAAALLEAASHRLSARGLDNLHRTKNVKDNFITIAAHELKTPLTVIEGYADMLRAEMDEQPRTAPMVKGLWGGIERLRELIEDLIDVSLIESGLLKLELQPVWLRRIVEIVMSGMREQIGLRHLTVEFHLETVPAKATIGDPERLLDVFDKVLANAIKYTPDNGKIVISGRELPGFIDIRVQDSGIGIALDDQDRIFEKFAMLGNPDLHSSGKTKFKGGGPGLGLAIAKGILEAHGGTIWVESPGYDETKHPGSCFHLMLPMRDVLSGEGMSPLIVSAVTALAGGPQFLPPVVKVVEVVAAKPVEKIVVTPAASVEQKIADELPGEVQTPPSETAQSVLTTTHDDTKKEGAEVLPDTEGQEKTMGGQD